MPTFIGAQGGGGNQIADAIKNLLQQTSPLNLAHASLYGATARKTQSEADKAEVLLDGIRQLRQDGVFDPNNKSQMGAAVVNGMTSGLADANRLRTSAVYGAADPRTDAAVVGAGGAYTTTAGGQGREIAGQNYRQGTVNDTAVKTNAATVAGSNINNIRDNDTRTATTGMTQAGEMARTQAQIESTRKTEEWKANNAFETVWDPVRKQNVLIPRGQVPSGAPAPATQSGEVGAILRNSQDPGGVMQGGAVPSQIPPTPTFTPGYQTPTRTMQVPLAHDLTNTVDVPDESQTPVPPSMTGGSSIVQPSLAVPPGLGGPTQAPASSQMLDGSPEPADPAWRQAIGIGNLAPGMQNVVGMSYRGPQTFVQYRPGQAPLTANTQDGIRGTILMPDGSSRLVDLRRGWTGVDSTVAAGEARGNNAAQTTGALEIPGGAPRGPESYSGQVGQAGGILPAAGREFGNFYGATGLPQFLGLGQIGGESQAAKQNLDTFNNVARTYLQNGPYKGKWQATLDGDLLPSGGVLQDPKADVMKVDNLIALARRDALKFQDRIRSRTSVDEKADRDDLQNAMNFLEFVNEPAKSKAFNNRDVPVVQNPSAAAAGQAAPGSAPPAPPAQAREVGKSYMTPRGVLTWTGVPGHEWAGGQ